MAYNIFDAIKEFISGKPNFANIELQNIRKNICNDCPFRSKINTCLKCGCFIPAKVKMFNANCPIGKW